MLVQIVNEHDEIIDNKDRLNLNYGTDIFRTVSLWVTNSDGDILLAQRNMDKKVDPGKWAEAVGGTVEGTDSYMDTIIREAEEELGITGVFFERGPKQFISSSARYFVQWYTIQIDAPIEVFVIQKEEVEQIAWIAKSELMQDLDSNPDKYIPSMKEIVAQFS